MSDRHVIVGDPDGHGAEVLTAAPGFDTGQKALAVRVVSQLGAGTGGGGGGAPAPLLNNVVGSNGAVTQGSTATLCTASAPYKFRGFHVSGGGDALWEVLLDGVVKYTARTHVAQRVFTLVLASYDNIFVSGTTVTLRVTNNGTGTTDFQAVMFGE